MPRPVESRKDIKVSRSMGVWYCFLDEDIEWITLLLSQAWSWIHVNRSNTMVTQWDFTLDYLSYKLITARFTSDLYSFFILVDITCN